MRNKTIIFIGLLIGLSQLSFAQKKQFKGVFTNGLKGAKCSFELSPDGKTLKDFIFTGYWRCSGKLDLMTMGPSKPIKVTNGKFDAVLVEPENGGATAFRFELHGQIKGKSASGTFRANLNAMACDTYVLNWTAENK